MTRQAFMRAGALGLLALALFLPAACGERASGLISRAALFNEPTRFQIRISPDGRNLSFLAPVDGAMQIWIAPSGDITAGRQLTKAKGHVVLYHRWSADGRTIVYEEAELCPGDDVVSHDRRANGRFARPDAARRRPGQGDGDECRAAGRRSHRSQRARSQMARRLSRDPIERLLPLVEENKGFAKFLADNDLNLRFALAPTRDGGLDLYKRAGKAWKKIDTVPPEDALNFKFLGFDKTNQNYFLIDSRGRNCTALVRMLAAGGWRDARRGRGIRHLRNQNNPFTNAIEAYQTNSDRAVRHVIDKSIAADLKFLGDAAGPDGTFIVLTRSADDRSWVLHYRQTDQAGIYYLYDRGRRS
ncbi:MAG: hypothetical protein U1E87_01600 [Alphaproteobacteria bacterium]